MKKPFCIRCSIIYALAAPPLIGWLILRKLMKHETFEEAAKGLTDKIKEYERLGKELEAMLVKREEEDAS